MSVGWEFESPQGGLCLSGGIAFVIASVAACAREAGYGDLPPLSLIKGYHSHPCAAHQSGC